MKRPALLLSSLLKDQSLTIAFAESVTCGLISLEMGSVQGASEIFSGSVICYDEAVKTGLLDVKKKTVAKYTAESQEVTDEMAKNLGKIIEADIHAAITGLAAPGGSESRSKPVGTVFCAFTFKNKLYRYKTRFKGTPLQVRKKGADAILRFIYKEVKQLETAL
jgi:nicotinamide-nucleotide amidase